MKLIIDDSKKKDYTGHVLPSGIVLGKYAGYQLKGKDQNVKIHYWKGRCKNCDGELLVSCKKVKTHLGYCNKCCAKKRGGHNYLGTHGDIAYSYFNHIKYCAKTRGLEFDITIEYIWEKYIEQDGQCAYTGIYIDFTNKYCSDYQSQTVSLDRIDSNKGYVKGNVQWVHKDINDMKMNLPHEDFLKYCKAITKHFNLIAGQTEMNIPILSYNSKEALKREIVRILGLYAGGQRIDHKSELLIRDIINLSRKKDHLIGCGLDYIIVANSGEFDTDCFHVVRTDGTTQAFSVQNIINAYKRTPQIKKPINIEETQPKEPALNMTNGMFVELDEDTKDVFLEFVINTDKISSSKKLKLIKGISHV